MNDKQVQQMASEGLGETCCWCYNLCCPVSIRSQCGARAPLRVCALPCRRKHHTQAGRLGRTIGFPLCEAVFHAAAVAISRNIRESCIPRIPARFASMPCPCICPCWCGCNRPVNASWFQLSQQLTCCYNDLVNAVQ